MIKRKMLEDLSSWAKEASPKPMLLTGARQVGKSYLIKELLADQFQSFVEVNFEENQDFIASFEAELTPESIIPKLEVQTGKKITPGETLLFFDEAQLCPKSVQSLRYFREQLPQQHVIAAGSLLEFTLEKISVPVGRVTMRHLTPLSFEEYLENSEYKNLLSELTQTEFARPFPEAIHLTGIKALKEYLAIGGMPEVVSSFLEHRDYNKVVEIQQDLLDTYEADIPKYSKKNSDYRYALTIFQQAPRHVSKVTTFSHISREIKSSYLRHGIELLSKAGLFTRCYKASTLPLKSSYQPTRYKLFFLDVGLLQRACRLDIARWIQEQGNQLASTGMLAEQFLASEILAHSNNRKEDLYYWERDKASSSAEIDFLIEKSNKIIPIEVKSGAAGTLKSMRWYLDNHPTTEGIRVSLQNITRNKDLLSIPAYAFGVWLERLDMNRSDLHHAN